MCLLFYERDVDFLPFSVAPFTLSHSSLALPPSPFLRLTRAPKGKMPTKHVSAAMMADAPVPPAPCFPLPSLSLRPSLPLFIAICAALYQSGGLHYIQGVNVAEVFQKVEGKITELGPWGYVLFAVIYILAEVRPSLPPSLPPLVLFVFLLPPLSSHHQSAAPSLSADPTPPSLPPSLPPFLPP